MSSKIERQLNDLGPILAGATVRGNENVRFDSVCSIHDSVPMSATWVKSTLNGYQDLLEKCSATLVVCDPGVLIPETHLASKCFVVVADPKSFFAGLVDLLFCPVRPVGIHPTALVSEAAVIGEGVYIGPFAVVGAVVMGSECSVGAYSVLADHVVVGSRVTIHQNVLVGSDGFGFVRNSTGKLEKFHHLGGVRLGDDVEIYPYSNVDRGTLGNTEVRRGTKIDHYCHIGHNCTVGEDSLLTAGIVLCGGSIVGDRCWIGVHSVVKEKVVVGDEVTVGIGSVVTKDVPSGQTWLGSPAEALHDFTVRRRALQRMLDERKD